jgi:hypothetical protein
MYIKKQGKNNHYTILKLSTQRRDPKVRYIQLNDIIEFTQQKHQFLKDQSTSASINDYRLLIEQYRDLMDNVVIRLKQLRDREKK